jgi:hypothetical protein
VDWCKRRYELFDRFDASHHDSDDERYVIDIHRSFGCYELYFYRDVGGRERTRRFDDVLVRYNVVCA